MKLRKQSLVLSAIAVAILATSSAFAFKPGKEIEITYYKTAAKTVEVGGYHLPCGPGGAEKWGKKTPFFTRVETPCD